MRTFILALGAVLFTSFLLGSCTAQKLQRERARKIAHTTGDAAFYVRDNEWVATQHHVLILCDYCGDEDSATPWLGHEPGCPDSTVSPIVLIDGLPECEVR